MPLVLKRVSTAGTKTLNTPKPDLVKQHRAIMIRA